MKDRKDYMTVSVSSININKHGIGEIVLDVHEVDMNNLAAFACKFLGDGHAYCMHLRTLDEQMELESADD